MADDEAQVLHIDDLRYGRNLFERWQEQNANRWSQVSKKEQRSLRHTIILSAALEVRTLQEASNAASGE